MSKKPKFEKQKLQTITSPIKVGSIELKNRMWMAPMNETLSGVNGEMTEQCLSYFAARAKGGAAVVSLGAVMGTEMCSRYVWGRNLALFHPGHLQGMTMLTERMHYFGSLVAAQMTIGFGRQGHSRDHHELVPSCTAGLPYEMGLDKQPGGAVIKAFKAELPRQDMIGQMTREMSINEIQKEQKEYANSCQLAVKAGFDIIEIHAPHGYLEHSFLSPVINKRTDMYGGEWRNRKRFLIEVAEQIRYACPGAVVGVRISNMEYFEGGLTKEEMIDVAQDMEVRGMDYISLSSGGGYEETFLLVPDKDHAAPLPDIAADFKKALRVPVIVASQHDPVKSDGDIAAGKFDIAALGRQLMIDPEYPNKVMSGDLDELKICTRCNTCLGRCLAGIGPGCPFNPELGREYANPAYMIGPRRKHEHLMPPAMINKPMPALDRPWWKPELPIIKKHFRKFRGPGPGPRDVDNLE
jgi:2,4-dienoyl-CoA reductase-like NADH-dependent reductase (Old Yellow Enzyme family)